MQLHVAANKLELQKIQNLFPLGDDVRFLPGHGPLSSFGAERRTNPSVGDHLFTRRTQERGA